MQTKIHKTKVRKKKENQRETDREDRVRQSDIEIEEQRGMEKRKRIKIQKQIRRNTKAYKLRFV